MYIKNCCHAQLLGKSLDKAFFQYENFEHDNQAEDPKDEGLGNPDNTFTLQGNGLEENDPDSDDANPAA